MRPSLEVALPEAAKVGPLDSRIWRGGWWVDLPSFQASAVFLLLYDDLLGWTLLVLHLIDRIMSASYSLPDLCIWALFLICCTPKCLRWCDMLGAKPLRQDQGVMGTLTGGPWLYPPYC